MQEKQMKADKMNRLRELGERLRSGDIDKETARLEYSAITGDMTGALRAQDPSALGGATGALVNRLMKENPNMSFSDALGQVQTGYRQGVTLEGGVATPIQGLGESLGSIAEQEKFGGKAGELQAELEAKPRIEQEVSRAKYLEEGLQGLPLAQRNLEAMESQNKFLGETIDEVAQANPWATGFVGSISSAVPGSPAHDVAKNLETVLAAAGLDKLVELKSQGGTLGAVSEKELALLQSSAQNLQQSQSYEQFQKNLASFKKQREESMGRVRSAYGQDYKRFGGEQDPNLPAPSTGKPATDMDDTELLKALGL
jgi:hypothetical protein